MPLVLRKKGKGQFSVVGPCYIDCVMLGHVVRAMNYKWGRNWETNGTNGPSTKEDLLDLANITTKNFNSLSNTMEFSRTFALVSLYN